MTSIFKSWRVLFLLFSQVSYTGQALFKCRERQQRGARLRKWYLSGIMVTIITVGSYWLCVSPCAWGGFIFIFYNLFLIGGQLLYNIVLVSAIHQHESAIGIHMPFSPAHPSHLWPHPTPLGSHRAPGLSSLHHTLLSVPNSKVLFPTLHSYFQSSLWFKELQPFHSHYNWGPSQALFMLKTEVRSQGWTLAKPWHWRVALISAFLFAPRGLTSRHSLTNLETCCSSQERTDQLSPRCCKMIHGV